MTAFHHQDTNSSLKVLNSSTHQRVSLTQKQNQRNFLRATCQPKIDNNYFKNSVSSVHKQQKETLKYQNDDIEFLRRQNETLKQQVSYLKKCLHFKQKNNSNIENQLFTKISKLQDQKANLKRIIQKSYNYIKEMELQSERIVNQNILQNKIKQKNVKFLSNENENLKNKLKNDDFIYQQQVKQLNNRIIMAQKRIQQLVKFMQNDQIQWLQYKNQIIRFKKVHFNNNNNNKCKQDIKLEKHKQFSNNFRQ